MLKKSPTFALLAAMVVTFCGCQQQPDEAGASKVEESEVDAETMAQLAAVGYANWSEDTDPGLKGAISHDPEATAPGYNFFADHAGRAFLLDLDGKPVHTWRFPSSDKNLFAELLEGGKVVTSLGKTTLAMLGPDSEVIWQLPLVVHHDVAVADDLSLYVLTHRWVFYQGRKVLFDGIAHVSPEGELLDVWWSFDYLPQLHRHHQLRPVDQPVDKEKKSGRVRRDYYHANTIELLPDTPLGQRDPRFRAGNLMINLHQVNLIVVLDQDDMSIVWTWGGDELDWPHMPTMLENGNILVFDNGSHRGHSRVLEIEPPSGEIVWSYEADPPEEFFTKFRGCSQRLPNGNTLICESERGRAFEVTLDGRVVWEFWNPLVEDDKRQTISRFIRYPAEFVAPLLQ